MMHVDHASGARTAEPASLLGSKHKTHYATPPCGREIARPAAATKVEDSARRALYRGRTAGCPTAPAQIPACPFRAPGSSEARVNRRPTSSGTNRLAGPRPNTDSRPWYLKMEKQVCEAVPRKATALTSPIEPFPRNLHAGLGQFPAGRAELSSDEAALKQITWPVDAAHPKAALAANPAPSFPSAAIWCKS